MSEKDNHPEVIEAIGFSTSGAVEKASLGF
jgi:hypothetical protein